MVPAAAPSIHATIARLEVIIASQSKQLADQSVQIQQLMQQLTAQQQITNQLLQQVLMTAVGSSTVPAAVSGNQVTSAPLTSASVAAPWMMSTNGGVGIMPHVPSSLPIHA